MHRRERRWPSRAELALASTATLSVYDDVIVQCTKRRLSMER